MAAAHQQGGHAVGTVGIRPELHPLGGESQHPAVETVHPYRVVGHTAGKCGYAVLAVPFGKLFKVGCKGMVFADVARAHKALDIPVSAVYACFDGFYAECVHPSFVRFGVAQVGAGHGPTKWHQSVEGGYEVTAWCSVGGNRS